MSYYSTGSHTVMASVLGKVIPIERYDLKSRGNKVHIAEDITSCFDCGGNLKWLGYDHLKHVEGWKRYCGYWFDYRCEKCGSEFFNHNNPNIGWGRGRFHNELEVKTN